MRKQIYFIVACVLVAGAHFVGSSLARHPSPAVVEAATTGSATPTTEMTIKYDRPLPVEHWDAY